MAHEFLLKFVLIFDFVLDQQGDDRFSYELFKISEWDGYLVGDFIPALFTFVLGASIFHYLRKKEPTMGSGTN
jgi:hypothetical protein